MTRISVWSLRRRRIRCDRRRLGSRCSQEHHRHAQGRQRQGGGQRDADGHGRPCHGQDRRVGPDPRAITACTSTRPANATAPTSPLRAGISIPPASSTGSTIPKARIRGDLPQLVAGADGKASLKLHGAQRHRCDPRCRRRRLRGACRGRRPEDRPQRQQRRPGAVRRVCGKLSPASGRHSRHDGRPDMTDAADCPFSNRNRLTISR